MTAITLEKLIDQVTVETTDSQLVVQMPDQKLEVGQHRFNLVVEDDAGNSSNTAQITVIIVDSAAPTALIDLHEHEQGRTITDGRVSFGAGFTLSGKRSVDVGGRIEKYIWEMVTP